MTESVILEGKREQWLWFACGTRCCINLLWLIDYLMECANVCLVSALGRFPISSGGYFLRGLCPTFKKRLGWSWCHWKVTDWLLRYWLFAYCRNVRHLNTRHICRLLKVWRASVTLDSTSILAQTFFQRLLQSRSVIWENRNSNNVPRAIILHSACLIIRTDTTQLYNTWSLSGIVKAGIIKI